MNKGEIFAILGIDETKDKEIIRSAYMSKLALTNPEDDPEGFKRLRSAYDEALALADEQDDNSPIGLWIKEVEKCYSDFGARCDRWSWEEILEDEVCTDEGCFENAREALLAFIMDHSYLPRFVFEMIIEALKIREDYEELCEKFPADFLDFVLRGGNGLNLELIKAEKGTDADFACGMWFDRRNAKAEGNTALVAELDEKYEEMNVFMPYYSVDLAGEVARENKERALEILKELEECVGKDGYITAGCAIAYINMGDKENALRLCDVVEEKYPKNIAAKTVRADALVMDGKYAEAKKIYEDLHGETNNPELFDKLRSVNKKLIETMKRDTVSDKIELGWCYYQNEMNTELMELMDSFAPEKEEDNAMYYNLRSRALLAVSRNEEALECIEKWRVALKVQKTDNDKDENDRKRRMVLSAFFGARCLRLMAGQNREKYEEYTERALDYANETTICDETQVVLQLLLERAVILMELKRFDEAINLCSDIIGRDRNCIPAYVIRQECNFEKRNAGAVIEDYRNLTELVPNLNWGMPYALTAHVFVVYDRYEDALAIVKRAEENNADSDYLRYVKASALRYSAGKEEETRAALEILLAIEKKNEDERTDFNSKRTLDLYEEICFAYMDLKEWDNAVKAIDKAIALDSENVERYRIKMDIYKKSENDKELNKCIAMLKKKYPKNPFVFYEQAKMLEGDNRKKAISLYKQAIKLDESYRDANSRLRELYQREYLDTQQQTYFKSALEYADKTIEFYPYAKGYLDRGILYMSAGMTDEAEADIKKAIELDDEYIVAYEWLGDCLRIQEKHTEALENYKEAYNLAKGNGNYYPVKDYALGCEAAKEFEKAAELLLEMTRDYPDEQYVWIDLGGVYEKAGENEKAYEAYMHYKTSFKLNDKSRTNVDMHLLELSFAMEGKKKEIFTILTETLEACPKSPEAYDNMAKYYCFYQNDRKLTYKFAGQAVSLAKSQYGTGSHEYRKIWGHRSQYAWIFKDNLKIKMFRVNSPFNPGASNINNTIERAFGDKRYKKMELYNIGLYAFFEGDRNTARKCFKEMQTGSNCSTCAYNFCVEALIGKALMLYDKGKTEEAAKCLEKVLDEKFDLFIFKRIMERIKEKK